MDLTSGPITKTLILFALPTLASNILQTLSGSVNSIWVGQFLGEAALAATANANIIMFLMFGAFFGFGMAATVLIGQSMGRGDVDAARRATGGVIGLALIFSVVIAIVGWFASDRIHGRSAEHTSELQALMRLSYAVFCLKKKNTH